MEIRHIAEKPIDQRINQKGKFKKIETKEHGSTTHQNLWNEAKEVLRGSLLQ